MSDHPYYENFPPFFKMCHQSADRFWAQFPAIATHVWMNYWYAPYVAMAKSAEFSDFGKES